MKFDLRLDLCHNKSPVRSAAEIQPQVADNYENRFRSGVDEAENVAPHSKILKNDEVEDSDLSRSLDFISFTPDLNLFGHKDFSDNRWSYHFTYAT
ncbi:MAG: hypothetical protein MHMPM18_004328, partial [Marteilia pararefringens]